MPENVGISVETDGRVQKSLIKCSKTLDKRGKSAYIRYVGVGAVFGRDKAAYVFAGVCDDGGVHIIVVIVEQIAPEILQKCVYLHIHAVIIAVLAMFENDIETIDRRTDIENVVIVDK